MLQKPKPCGVKKQTEAARKSCTWSVSGQVSQKQTPLTIYQAQNYLASFSQGL